MISSVADYLSLLRKELAGSDPSTIQKALSDSEEYLRRALEYARATDSSLSEAEVLASIIEKYGAPGEVAAAYRESENEEWGAEELGWKQVLFSFQGRLERKRYIIATLLLLVAILAPWIGWIVWLGTIGTQEESDLFSLILLSFAILTILLFASTWPDAALATKRLRDMNREPMLVLLFVMLPSLPVIGGPIKIGMWIWLMVARGTEGTNKYGPPPRERQEST